MKPCQVDWNEALPDKALADDNEEADEEAAACCTYVGNAVYVLHGPLDPGSVCFLGVGCVIWEPALAEWLEQFKTTLCYQLQWDLISTAVSQLAIIQL